MTDQNKDEQKPPTTDEMIETIPNKTVQDILKVITLPIRALDWLKGLLGF